MDVIIDKYGVPGGCNDMDIGEADGNNQRWNSTSNLDLSSKAVESVIDYIQTSGYTKHYTLELVKEPQDNLTGLLTLYALSPSGRVWLKRYIDGVLDRVKAVNAKIPVMARVFPWDIEWSKKFHHSSTIVLDIYHYYFMNTTSASTNMSNAFCTDAVSDIAGSEVPHCSESTLFKQLGTTA